MEKRIAEEIYYLMELGRRFEYAAKEHYMTGEISGFLHLDIGQEGLSVAAMRAFDHGDVFTTYREHVMAIARGIEPRAVMAELFGKATGVSGGKGGSMHLFDPSHFFYGGDAIVGGHLPNAVGCAYARKLQNATHGVMALFGDGASNGGAFFESLNIASAWKLPVLFLCENNRYAIGTEITRVSPFLEQAKKAEPYMPTMEVDGMDAVAVYEAVSEAREYIEKGHGPIFVEAFTCRYEGHSMSDAGTYRSVQEMEICKSKDPIVRMKKYLHKHYGMEEAYFEEVGKKAQAVVDAAVEYAAQSPEPDTAALYEHVFCKECSDVVS
ncbi:thiamine pyrophosphate-dependent dehydrogenase E1 component subunit alpha [Nitratifractor sp.]